MAKAANTTSAPVLRLVPKTAQGSPLFESIRAYAAAHREHTAAQSIWNEAFDRPKAKCTRLRLSVIDAAGRAMKTAESRRVERARALLDLIEKDF